MTDENLYSKIACAVTVFYRQRSVLPRQLFMTNDSFSQLKQDMPAGALPRIGQDFRVGGIPITIVRDGPEFELK